MDLRYEETI
jgi:hypothetical protein